MAQEVLEVPGLEYNFLEMVVQVVLEVLVALFDLPSQVVLEFQGNHRLLYHPLRRQRLHKGSVCPVLLFLPWAPLVQQVQEVREFQDDPVRNSYRYIELIPYLPSLMNILRSLNL